MEEVCGDNLSEVGTLKTMRTMMIISIFIFISVGCSRTAYIGTQNSRGLNNPCINEKIDTKYPPVLVMGSRFTYQDTNLSDGKVYKVTAVMEVKEKREFEKKSAYWINVSREGKNYFDIYDMNLNWIGSFAECKELEFAEPCIRVFKWPLRVGDKWTSEYTLRDYSKGVYLPPSRVAVNVRTYEEVTVPAGTFKALRIQAGKETFWYAPSIGWVVKERIGSYNNDGWLLELVEYSIPHRIAGKEPGNLPWKQSEICQ